MSVLPIQRILIVEDGKDIFQTLSSAGPIPNLEIHRIADGNNVPYLLARQKYELIILAYPLNSANSIELTHRLKQVPHTASMPVVLIGFKEHLQEVLATRTPDLLLAKPLIPRTLSSAIQLLLRLQKNEGSLKHYKENAEKLDHQLSLNRAELTRLNVFMTNVISALGGKSSPHIKKMIQHVEKFQDLFSDIKACQANLDESLQRIENLSRRLALDHNTQPLCDKKLILVVNRDEMQRHLIEQAIFVTGADVHTASCEQEALSILQQNPYNVLFVDGPNAHILDQAVQIRPSIKTVLMVNQSIFETTSHQDKVLPISTIFGTNILAQGKTHDPLTTREIVATAGKLISNDIFCLEKYLSWGTAVQEINITNSQDRIAVVQVIFDYARHCGIRKRYANQIRILADELLMNAIFDAPVDNTGTPKYAHRSREEQLLLLPQERVTVRFGSDANCFGVSVIDNFGRLEYQHALSYLRKCFAKNSDQINTGPGGAGLGLYLAYNTVSSLIINVTPQHKTEVIGLFHLHRPLSNEDMDKARSFCYFTNMLFNPTSLDIPALKS